MLESGPYINPSGTWLGFSLVVAALVGLFLLVNYIVARFGDRPHRQEAEQQRQERVLDLQRQREESEQRAKDSETGS
jgi:hypothetical protein